MHTAKPSASKNSRVVIRPPKNVRRHQKLQHRSRAGSRAPGKTMPACPAWSARQPAPAPGPCVCNRS